MRYTVEIFLFLQKNSDPVIIPKIPEMSFNTIAKLWWYVSRASKWLILNLFNKYEPSLQTIFVVIEIR